LGGLLSVSTAPALSPNCLFHGLPDGSKPGQDIRAEVNAQRAPATRGEDLEIPASLRGLHDAEAVALVGHGKI